MMNPYRLRTLAGAAGLICFLLIYESRGSPFAHLFNESYFGTYVKTISSSKQDLSGNVLEGRIASAQVRGVWAFYRFPNFNQDKDPLQGYILWGQGSAQTGHLGSLAHRVGSIRLIGGVKDAIPNLRIYDGTYFTGAERIIIKSTPSMHYMYSSLILKNCKAWTIYSEVDYQGSSVCLYPNDTSEVCSPWFFFDQKDYNLTSIRSVRKGCHSANKVSQE